jgi:hypothetical protein
MASKYIELLDEYEFTKNDKKILKQYFRRK